MPPEYEPPRNVLKNVCKSRAYIRVFTVTIWNFEDLFRTSILILVENFMKLACLEVAFPKIEFFWILVYSSDKLCPFWCCFSSWIKTSSKHFIFIPILLPELLRPMSLSCLKKQMPLTVKYFWKMNLIVA